MSRVADTTMDDYRRMLEDRAGRVGVQTIAAWIGRAVGQIADESPLFWVSAGIRRPAASFEAPKRRVQPRSQYGRHSAA